MTPELLTIPQFCEAVNCGRTRAYQLINEGHVRALKNNRKTLIPRSEIERWIESLPSYNEQL